MAGLNELQHAAAFGFDHFAFAAAEFLGGEGDFVVMGVGEEALELDAFETAGEGGELGGGDVGAFGEGGLGELPGDEFEAFGFVGKRDRHGGDAGVLDDALVDFEEVLGD